MSGSLLEIKKKIKGVNNTRKITKAMQLVAASKMKYFQDKAVTSKDFVSELLQILEKNINEELENTYTEQREEGKVLFVLYTSDKGLCGPLNTKLINCLFRSNRWNELNNDERMLITIGKKSKAFADNNKIKTEKDFVGIPEKINHLDALKIVEKIISLWQKKEVKEVVFIAPHYKNSFTNYPVMKTFLPFSEKEIRKNLGLIKEQENSEEHKEGNNFMIFEPSPEVVLNRIYEFTIQAVFISSFLELKASEYSSRMIAMQNATDAADKMIGELKRTFNKARQAAITQEIAELIGASMALED